MKRFFCLLFIFVLTCKGTVVYAVNTNNVDKSTSDFTYLVLGLDDAGDNTDVMLLVRYVSSENTVTLIQIPRDTYISQDTPQHKINQIYATQRCRGSSAKEAFATLTGTLMSTFGFKIDGYVAYTTDAFVKFIDALSGVDVDLQFDLEINDGETDFNLKRGKVHLSGEGALSFVRYRKGYLMGDLGRIDAQKILFSSIVKKFKGSTNIAKLLMLVLNNRNDITTNIKAGDIINIALKNRGRIKNMRFEYLTLPGSSVKSDSGIWYFSACQNAVQSFYNEKNIRAEFDADKLFCNFNSDSFINIYNNRTITPRVYDDDSLKELKVRQGVG